METKYFTIKEIPFKGKTKKFNIISKSSGYILGEISWYRGWRRYVFLPVDTTVWSEDCLKDIGKFLGQLTIERKDSIEGCKK